LKGAGNTYIRPRSTEKQQPISIEEMSIDMDNLLTQHTEALNISQSSSKKEALSFHLAIKGRGTVNVQMNVTVRTIMTRPTSLSLVLDSRDSDTVDYLGGSLLPFQTSHLDLGMTVCNKMTVGKGLKVTKEDQEEHIIGGSK